MSANTFLLSEYTFEWVVLKFVTQIGSRKDVSYRISLPIVLMFKTTIDPKSRNVCAWGCMLCNVRKVIER